MAAITKKIIKAKWFLMYGLHWPVSPRTIENPHFGNWKKNYISTHRFDNQFMGPRFILLLFLMTVSASVHAQLRQGTSILYKYDERYLSITINGFRKKLPDRYCRMAFTDSLSFTYGFSEGQKDPFKGKDLFSMTGLQMATYYYPGSHTRFSVLKKKKKIYQVTDSAQYYRWELFDDYKVIAGFNCRSALSFRNQTDSVIAWFTTEIPGTFSPGWYTGLPGIVLELQDNYTGERFSAIKIESLRLDIHFPESAIPVKDLHKLK